MHFRTNYNVPKFPFEISHKDKILTIGSCFSENISDCLNDRKFEVFNNPFGILFHPIAIHNALRKIAKKEYFSEQDLMLYKEQWLSLYHHSSFNGLDKDSVLDKINQNILGVYNFIKEADVIFITYGTAWGYEYLGEALKFKGKIVGNCHKIPNHQFRKVLSSFDMLLNDTKSIIEFLKTINPHLKIVFTLSPVRHLKDGFQENQVSKSILRLLIHEIVENFNHCFYFPSYEIILDDLRDYRFFKKDMVHPNEQAIEYVWEQFSEVFFSKETQILNQKIEKIQAGLKHRPQFSDSNAYQKFKTNLQLEINSLEECIKERF